MAENKTMDQIHRQILKKFHTLCSVLGLSDEEKRLIVASYGVESSRDIDTHDLVDICAKLSAQADSRSGHADMDRLRKRTMASIGTWLRLSGQQSNADIIKGLACRATGYADFNKIPRQRLRNLYFAFRQKAKDLQSVGELTDAIIRSRMQTKADC